MKEILEMYAVILLSAPIGGGIGVIAAEDNSPYPYEIRDIYTEEMILISEKAEPQPNTNKQEKKPKKTSETVAK